MAIPATSGVPLPKTQETFYRNVRSAVQTAWASINALQSLQREWNKADYGTTLIDAGASDGDLNGITAAEVGECVFAAADALGTVLDSGTGGQMVKLL
jgi:hypothetical protein